MTLTSDAGDNLDHSRSQTESKEPVQILCQYLYIKVGIRKLAH